MKNLTCEFTRLDWLLWEKLELRNKIKHNYTHCRVKGSPKELLGLQMKVKYLELEKEIREEIKS